MNMLSGSMWDKILLFALPLAASSILQQLFNSADVAIVGRFAGKQALAAVGSNGPIINLLVNIFVGLSIGSNVVISRYIGQGNENRIRRAVHTSILLAVLSGLFVAVLGILITKPMLSAMSTPSDIIDLSTKYLRIYFLGMPFLMLYNFSAAILRSRGDTRRPLICLTISGVLNVLLNLVFVIILHMDVDGVAIATVISQMASAGMLIFLLVREKGALKLNLKHLGIDVRILKEIAKIGVPSGLQGMVFSASNVCIQSSMNSLGSTVVAASSAAINFEIYVYYMINGFSNATVTFTGQNYGAGNQKRCTAVVWNCLGLGALFTGCMALLFIIFSGAAAQIYTNDPAVMELALERMRLVLCFQIINLSIEVFSGAMRGLGYSLIPALISMIGICGVRLIWVATVFPKSSTFLTLIAVYPISWGITASAIFASYFIVRKRAYAKIKL